MPRSKPTGAAPSFTVEPHPLTESAQTRLIELLWFANTSVAETAAPRAIAKVQKGLGFYISGQPHIDHIPRPAHYVAAFKSMHLQTVKLLEKLTSLKPYLRKKFEARAIRIDTIEEALRSMDDASRAIVEEFETQSSKGAPKNTALTEVIRRLRRIFRDNYHGPRTGRVKKGAFTYLAEWEKREGEFVAVALRDALIMTQKDLDTRLPDLFLDARCAVVRERAERADLNERIAKKVPRSGPPARKKNIA